MNPLTDNLVTGTVGELLVQLRLFQYDVQAAPPLKDSGNDLIAVRGNIFRAVQVKTTNDPNGKPQAPKDRRYHILAFVRLAGEGNELYLDKSAVYLFDKEEITNNVNADDLEKHKISQEVVDRLFPTNDNA